MALWHYGTATDNLWILSQLVYNCYSVGGKFIPKRYLSHVGRNTFRQLQIALACVDPWPYYGRVLTMDTINLVLSTDLIVR